VEQLQENWGGVIKKLRLSKGLSQVTLGARAGMARSYIYRIEKGDFKYPSYRNIVTFARGLDIPFLLLMLDIYLETDYRKEVDLSLKDFPNRKDFHSKRKP